MNFKTDYRLENFILNTKYNDVPIEVKERLNGCFLDLLGALIAGSKSKQFKAGLSLADKIGKSGSIAVIGSKEKFDFFGAATAMGHSSNAYDIDDGHNIIRAHPGTSFIGGLLAEAYDKNLHSEDFLTALYVAYEATIRMGAAIMDYYNYAHSSGTFGAIGMAVGVGRMRGYSKEQMNNVISVAEFNAPLVPGIRSVEYPSMNKDGVPFGVMIGALALSAHESGFTGNKNLLEADEYRHYLDNLGEKHEVMDLYFKPYPCCRWGHPAIDACLSLLDKYEITYADIENVTIETFYKATQLSKGIPSSADEAQYNIAYPVASAIVNKGFSIKQVEETNDATVHQMMNRLSFVCADELDKEFPNKRLCRAVMVLKDGRTVTSDVHEPRGEACENIRFTWLAEKFKRITSSMLTKEAQEKLISIVIDGKWKTKEIVDIINANILT